MEDRRSLYRAEDAVSPVIAVILMVAITVVLAATVFALVSDLGGKGQKNAPHIAFAQDETKDMLSVTASGVGANWNRVSIKAPFDGGAYFDADGTSNDASLTLAAGTFAPVGPNNIPVKPSDKLCFWSTDGAQSNVRFEIRDEVASMAIGQGWVFGTVATTPKTAC
ncbi:MAG: type IV pilin N-terminal domain-containing protein [Euryarchaeota archaeon]|nr:type IV pilin N-terminal domain-containing protein [Euryarchaeota archaeon]